MTLMSGGFEVPETEWLVARVRPGTAAVDVGANVGMFTVPLAARAERVLALEPAPSNVAAARGEPAPQRARRTSTVRPVAAGERPGKLVLRLGDDSMFHSTTEVGEGRGTGRRARGRGDDGSTRSGVRRARRRSRSSRSTSRAASRRSCAAPRSCSPRSGPRSCSRRARRNGCASSSRSSARTATARRSRPASRRRTTRSSPSSCRTRRAARAGRATSRLASRHRLEAGPVERAQQAAELDLRAPAHPRALRRLAEVEAGRHRDLRAHARALRVQARSLGWTPLGELELQRHGGPLAERRGDGRGPPVRALDLDALDPRDHAREQLRVGQGLEHGLARRRERALPSILMASASPTTKLAKRADQRAAGDDEGGAERSCRPTSSVRRRRSAAISTPHSDSVATSGETTVTRPR